MAGAYWTIDAIREEITALQNTASFQKPDFYRAFTRRIKELFSDLQVVKGDDTIRTVDIIYANPERAIAKIMEGKSTRLPILSLQLDGIELALDRRKPMEALVEKKFWIPDKQRAVRYMALAPVAANLSFAVNVWGKYVEEVNQLTEQILLMFRPNLPVDIRPDETYQAYVRDVSDSFQVDVGDKQDRVLKRVIRFNVESYVPSKVFKFTNTGEIITMNFEAYIEETNGLETLESFMAGGGQEFLLNQQSRVVQFTTTVPSTPPAGPVLSTTTQTPTTITTFPPTTFTTLQTPTTITTTQTPTTQTPTTQTPTTQTPTTITTTQTPTTFTTLQTSVTTTP